MAFQSEIKARRWYSSAKVPGRKRYVSKIERTPGTLLAAAWVYWQDQSGKEGACSLRGFARWAWDTTSPPIGWKHPE